MLDLYSRAFTGLIGNRMSCFHAADSIECKPMGITSDDQSRQGRSAGQAASTAAAMLAAALPRRPPRFVRSVGWANGAPAVGSGPQRPRPPEKLRRISPAQHQARGFAQRRAARLSCSRHCFGNRLANLHCYRPDHPGHGSWGHRVETCSMARRIASCASACPKEVQHHGARPNLTDGVCNALQRCPVLIHALAQTKREVSLLGFKFSRWRNNRWSRYTPVPNRTGCPRIDCWPPPTSNQSGCWTK